MTPDPEPEPDPKYTLLSPSTNKTVMGTTYYSYDTLSYNGLNYHVKKTVSGGQGVFLVSSNTSGLQKIGCYFEVNYMPSAKYDGIGYYDQGDGWETGTVSFVVVETLTNERSTELESLIGSTTNLDVVI